MNHTGLSPAEVTPAVIRGFITDQRDKRSATTAHHSLLTLRVFFNYLLRDGFLETNPALAVDKPKRRKTVLQTLSDAQVNALLDNCARDFCGTRDRALMLLMLDTGARVQEVLSLREEDLSLDRQIITVTGKGDKERQIPFGSGVRTALAAYFARRGAVDSSALVFVNHYGEALTRHAIRAMLRKRGSDAKVTGVRLSPHTFRHTFAKQWLINGGDAFSLQRMLGHSTMEMVRNYVNLLAGEVQEIHRHCSPVDRMQGPKQGQRKRMR